MFSLLNTAVMALVKRLPGLKAYHVYSLILKMLGPEHVVATYFGAKMHCKLSDFVQGKIFLFGFWEPNISWLIEQNLAPGDVFVDLGANVGYDTLLGSKLVGPAGRVVSIEASPRTFALLQRNLALNGTPANIRPVNVAVYNRPCQLDIYEISKGNIGAATILPARGGTRMASIAALPLDQILTLEEIGRLRLIKMDIEGLEPPVLRQLLDKLSLYPPTMDIIVEANAHHDFETWCELFNKMKAAGFAAFEILNVYDLDWYMQWRRPTPPWLIKSMTNRQQDLLFSRRADLSLSIV